MQFKNGVTVLAFKMGHFYWLSIKNSSDLYTEFSLGYLGEAKFCRESKASFIDISSIASFKRFLIAWLREYSSFSDNSVVGLKFSPWPKYTQLGTISPNKIVFHYQTFFLLKYVLH